MELPIAADPPATPAVVFNNTKSLSAWLVPGAACGEGQLTVFDPVGLRYTANVAVTSSRGRARITFLALSCLRRLGCYPADGTGLLSFR